MKYNIDGKYEVLYNADGVDELTGAYKTEARAVKAADKVMDRVAYGIIYIKTPKETYEYWPTNRKRMRR